MYQTQVYGDFYSVVSLVAVKHFDMLVVYGDTFNSI